MVFFVTITYTVIFAPTPRKFITGSLHKLTTSWNNKVTLIITTRINISLSIEKRTRTFLLIRFCLGISTTLQTTITTKTILIIVVTLRLELLFPNKETWTKVRKLLFLSGKTIFLKSFTIGFILQIISTCWLFP